MNDNIGTGWVRFFYIAAAFNLAIGLLVMLTASASVDVRIIGVLIFAFGVIYWLVAREPVRFGPTLWAGVIGKLAMIGLMAPTILSETMSSGQSSIQMNGVFALLILASYLIFALGFLAFLFKSDGADEREEHEEA